jgi:hypothetical protein
MCIILGFAIKITAFQQLKLKISLNRARTGASTIYVFVLPIFNHNLQRPTDTTKCQGFKKIRKKKKKTKAQHFSGLYLPLNSEFWYRGYQGELCVLLAKRIRTGLAEFLRLLQRCQIHVSPRNMHCSLPALNSTHTRSLAARRKHRRRAAPERARAQWYSGRPIH